MGEITGNIEKGIKGVKRIFLNTLRDQGTGYLDFMSPLSMDGEIVNLAVAGTAPMPRAWTDERHPAGLKKTKFSIQSTKVENSLAIDKNALRRDSLGIYEPSIKELAVRMSSHPWTILSLLRSNSTAADALAFDGVPFHYNAHTFGKSGAQANIQAQTGTTAANIRTDYYLRLAAMIKWLDDQGQVDRTITQFLKLVVVHGPSMQAAMDEAFNISTLSSGGSNPTFQAVKTQCDPGISGNGWVLENHGGIVKPYGLGEEFPIEFEEDTSESFMRGMIMFGCEWNGCGFYGNPRDSHLVGTL